MISAIIALNVTEKDIHRDIQREKHRKNGEACVSYPYHKREREERHLHFIKYLSENTIYCMRSWFLPDTCVCVCVCVLSLCGYVCVTLKI